MQTGRGAVVIYPGSFRPLVHAWVSGGVSLDILKPGSSEVIGPFKGLSAYEEKACVF